MTLTFAGVIAALKGATWISKIAGFASLIPGAGPIAAAVKAGADLLVTVIKAFFEGLTICFANPVVFTVIAAAFAGGLWQGVEWEKHKVEVARAETKALQKANRDADEDSKRRLAGANEARIAAEKAAKDAEDRAARFLCRGKASRFRRRRQRIVAVRPSGLTKVRWSTCA
jgi:hypothetical protein